MTHAQLLATGLACLVMGVPIAMASWAYFAANRGAQIRRSPHVPAAPAAGRRARVAWVAYLAAVGLAALWVAVSVASAGASPRDASRALILFLSGSALAAAAPLRPLLGPLAYILVSYALPREDAITHLLFDAHSEALLTALSAAALVLWSRIDERGLKPPKSADAWALLLFTFWVGVVVLAAMWNGHPIHDGLVHRTGRVIQCVVLCLVAYYSRPSVGEIQLLIVSVAVMLGIRAGRFTDGVKLEQNLAALVAIAIPWTIALTLSLNRWWARLASIPLSIGLIALLVYIANRGSFLGLAAGAVAVWATARWRWRIAAFVAPIAMLLLAGVLSQTELGQRLDSAYESGGFRESAGSRIELWQLGLDLARQHPIFGVGPENYAQYFNDYYEVNWNMGAHNIFVDVMAETGYVGLLLFAAIWVFASIALARSAARIADRRAKYLLLAGLAGIWVYLIAGFFLSLASLTFIYILLGLSLGTAANAEFLALGVGTPAKTASGSSPGRDARRGLDSAALLYTGLIVLGSLAPFEFQSVGPTAAVRRILELDWLPHGHISRVDLVSNVALFVPLGFLVMGSLTCDVRSPLRRLAGAAATIAGCAGVGVAVEVLQCWFPTRTVSAYDVMAQILGTLIGAALWACAGQRGVNAWRRWKSGRADLSTVQKAILVYVAALLMWTIWPLEVTLHPVELWHKYQAGGIQPFRASDYAAPLSGGASSPLARLLLSTPIGWLLSSAWLRAGTPWRAWRCAVLWALAAAGGIEMLRVMAPEQMASGDQCLVTFVGILLGCLAHRRISRATTPA